MTRTCHPAARPAVARCWHGLVVGAAGLFSAGCLGSDNDNTQASGSTPDQRREQAPSSAFAEQFQILSEFELEEGGDVINVTPEVRFAGGSELLVADHAERQVRSYSSSGALRWSIKHPTLSRPLVAIRFNDTTAVVVDAGGEAGVIHLGRFGQGVRSGPPMKWPARIHWMDDVDVISDSLVLISARPRSTPEAHMSGLHIVEPLSGRVLRSFFYPHMSPEVADLSRAAGFIKSAVRGDTIASVFALCDTIFLHLIDGATLARIPLPTNSFRTVSRPRRAGEGVKGWSSGLSFASAISWLPTGDFVVEFSEFEHNVPLRHLIGVSRSGARIFQIDGSPRMHDSLPNGDFLFSSPSDITTNRLVLAQRRE